MKKSKTTHSVEPKPEPKPEPKYVVVYLGWNSDVMRTIPKTCAEVFITADDAVDYAEGKRDARIFGLNPEYGFEVTRTLTVKP